MNHLSLKKIQKQKLDPDRNRDEEQKCQMTLDELRHSSPVISPFCILPQKMTLNLNYNPYYHSNCFKINSLLHSLQVNLSFALVLK